MRGGARRGAGRPKGSVTAKTRAIAEEVAASGMSPIEVILILMRRAMDQGEWDKAHKFACAAAPYIHPRVAAVAMTSCDDDAIIVIERDSLDIDT